MTASFTCLVSPSLHMQKWLIILLCLNQSRGRAFFGGYAQLRHLYSRRKKPANFSSEHAIQILASTLRSLGVTQLDCKLSTEMPAACKLPIIYCADLQQEPSSKQTRCPTANRATRTPAIFPLTARLRLLQLLVTIWLMQLSHAQPWSVRHPCMQQRANKLTLYLYRSQTWLMLFPIYPSTMMEQPICAEEKLKDLPMLCMITTLLQPPLSDAIDTNSPPPTRISDSISSLRMVTLCFRHSPNNCYSSASCHARPDGLCGLHITTILALGICSARFAQSIQKSSSLLLQFFVDSWTAKHCLPVALIRLQQLAQTGLNTSTWSWGSLRARMQYERQVTTDVNSPQLQLDPRVIFFTFIYHFTMRLLALYYNSFLSFSAAIPRCNPLCWPILSKVCSQISMIPEWMSRQTPTSMSARDRSKYSSGCLCL